MFLLDTNVCIAVLNASVPAVIERFEAQSPATISLCSVVVAELMFGARRSQRPGRTLAAVERFLAPLPSWPFDDRAAQEYGFIRADLERAGTPIGGNDLMIASIARARDLMLVTHNTREFRRIVGLRLEDWQPSDPR